MIGYCWMPERAELCVSPYMPMLFCAAPPLIWGDAVNTII